MVEWLNGLGFGGGSTYWYPRASMNRSVLPLVIATSAMSRDVTGRRPPTSGRSLKYNDHVCCGVWEVAPALWPCDIPLDTNVLSAGLSLSPSLITTSLASVAACTVSEDPAETSPTSCR